ncbi:MAG: methyltransferase domain-containing protein [Bryobacteraceae bacterium]
MAVNNMPVCGLCGAPEAHAIAEVGPFRLYQCRECCVQFRRHASGVDQPDEFSQDERALEGYEELYAPGRTRTYNRILEALGEGAGRRFLDVGCALGWLMQAAGRRGYETWGIEPHSRVARRASQMIGRPVEAGTLEDTRHEDASFDVVTMMDVLEHAVAPASCLDRVWRLLDDGGTIVIRVPDMAGLLPRVSLWMHRLTGGRFAQPLWLLWRFHRWGFDGRSLARLLEERGFRVVARYGEDAQDLTMMRHKPWARSKLVYWAVAAIIHLSHFGGSYDEVVMVARKGALRRAARQDRLELRGVAQAG